MENVVPSLNYASVNAAYDHVRRARIFRRVVLGCTFAPMGIGAGIVLLYWLTDWEGLPVMGLLMLPVGALTVFVGMIFDALWFWQERAYARKSERPIPYRAVVVLTLLLLANFPVAYMCMQLGAKLVMEPTVSVEVHNESGVPIDPCVVASNWSSQSARMVAGGEMTARFRLRRSGGLRLHLEQVGKTKDVPLVFPPGGGGLFDSDPKITIHVRPSLEVEVESTPGG